MSEKVPYFTADGSCEWFVERVAYNLKPDETIEAALAKEFDDYQDCVADMIEEGDECTQSWVDVVKAMRAVAQEIAGNAATWFEALDAELKQPRIPNP